MIRKSNSLLKILFSSICLISGSAMAAPITDLSKQIVSEKPGSILSIAQQDETDLFLHADQRLLVNYRSRGVNGEPIVASAFILLPKVHLRVIMPVDQFTHIRKLLQKR